MAEIKFSQLTTAAQLTNDDIFALAQLQGGSLSSVKTSMIAVANFLNTQVQYTTAYNTQAKTTAGAINELKQLISLIPQFSIEVVEELPTEDISDTTIYLVPAENPEVGNYYEEYIHVNNTWELVGTTAVDLSEYYTKLEVDGLLATKASVTEVALKENKSDMPTDVRTIIKDCKTPKNATITNGIAQFECIDKNFVKALKLTMNPIQDLHGYSNPWVGGAGKNKFNDTIGTHTINANTDVTLLIGSVDLVADTTYTISCKQTPNTVTWVRNLLAIKKQGTTSTIYNSLGSGDTIRPMTYTPSDTATYDILVWGHTLSADTTYSDFQVEVGSTATSYAPYSNICPISGRTEASVTRTAGEDVETKTHQYGQAVYGGEDDFVNGGLTNEFGVVDLGTLDYTYYAQYNTFYTSFAGGKRYSTTEPVKYISSAYKAVNRIDGNTPDGCFVYNTDYHGVNILSIKDNRFTNATAFKTAVSGQTMCYELATPTTIQTSAEDITTVEGTNIISGTEPISECKYTELATVDDLIKIIGGQ